MLSDNIFYLVGVRFHQFYKSIIAHDWSKEFHWKFNPPVAARMIQLQNPLLRFHKTTKGNFSGEDFKSAQRFLFWLTLTFWPKSCPIVNLASYKLRVNKINTENKLPFDKLRSPLFDGNSK